MHNSQCTIKNIRAKEQKIFKILLWKKVCVFQTQSIYYRPYRAGRRLSASAYAAISKIIALQAIWTKGFIRLQPQPTR